MQRAARLALLVTLVLSVSTMAAAQSFDVRVEAVDRFANPVDGESATFNIHVTNNAGEERRFSVSEWGGLTPPQWYTLAPNAFRLQHNETGVSVLTVTPERTAVEGNKGVTITVSSNGEQVQKRFSYGIQHDRSLIITDFETSGARFKPGEQVTATITVRNVRDYELPANAYQAVFTLGGQDADASLGPLAPSEEQTVNATISLDRFDSGVLTLLASVERLDGTVQEYKTANIRVESVENVQTMKKTSSQIVSRTTTLTAANQGNVPSADTTVSAAVPGYLSYFVSYDTEPTTVTERDGRTQYTWNLGSISPGEERSITYRVNYWVPLAILLILLIAGVVTVREYRRPHVKKHTQRSNGKHNIHITVQNRSGQHLDDVRVKDFVPGIATLIGKFDASPPETIREVEEGTELEWNLGRLDPGEERILSYTISPQVQVEGSVLLPPAHLHYRADGSEKDRHSHHAHADFR